jgi:hypothetical protein
MPDRESAIAARLEVESQLKIKTKEYVLVLFFPLVDANTQA